MSGNEKGEQDGQGTIELDTACHDTDPIARYASGWSAVALGTYREIGLMTRVVQ
jgi:hypothetical protein